MARLLWTRSQLNFLPSSSTRGHGGYQSNFGIAFRFVRRSPPRPSSVFRLDLGGDRLGHLLIMVELHCEGRAPLTHGTQRVDVAEHVGERDHRIDDVGVAAHVLALDMAAA